MQQGFDNDQCIEMQSQRIRERIDQFGGKLYLEFGCKLFDDYHASRVLPGFEPDLKARMLSSLASDAEVRGLARALVRSGRAREIAVGGAWFLEFACDSQG